MKSLKIGYEIVEHCNAMVLFKVSSLHEYRYRLWNSLMLLKTTYTQVSNL